MIRFILIAICLICYLIFFIPVLGVLWVVRKFNKSTADIASLRLVQGAFRIMLKIAGTNITILGKENVPTDQAVLYVGNHQSYFDILITYVQCQNLTGYVAKKSMEKIPLLSTWMKRVYCLFIDRDDVKEALKTILVGIDRVKNGISICIFPEGTRNKNPETLLPFKEGSLKIAEKSGCPIIPMAISNSSKIFEAQFPRIRKCHVILEYGTPIYPKELEKEERKFLGAYTQTQIRTMLDKHNLML